ncbi:hypothetical protein HYT55_04060 [Candidatus Woesearchaeota archaeon]|nr:hypothetical protein [Candidatus Woesearchaeota archaeon]
MTRTTLLSGLVALFLGCSTPFGSYRRLAESERGFTQAGLEMIPSSFCSSHLQGPYLIRTVSRLLERYGVQTKPSPCSEYTSTAILDEKYRLTLTTLYHDPSCSSSIGATHGTQSLEMTVDSLVRSGRAVLVVNDVLGDSEPQLFFIRQSAFGEYRVPTQDEAAVHKILESACVLTQTLRANYEDKREK